MLVHDRDLHELWQLLHNPGWPYAIQKNSFDSGDDKRYLNFVVREDLANLKILNVTHKFDRLRSPLSEYNTHHWDMSTELVDQYNIAFLYDVIDHVDSNPVELLETVRQSLHGDGVVYMRCHPWTSRDPMHLSGQLNKAYIHLVFTDEELSILVPEFVKAPVRKLSVPLLNYGQMIRDSGFKIVYSYARMEPPEEFFFGDQVFNKIMANNTFTTHGTFDWFHNTRDQMSIQFVDYILAKA